MNHSRQRVKTGKESTSPSIARRSQQALEQRRLLGSEWIDHSHSAPRETILEIFAQKQSTTVLGSYSQNECIPNWQPVVNAQVKGGLECRPSGVSYLKAVSPTENRLSG